MPSRTTGSGYVYDDEADGLVREALELNQMSIDEFCLQVLRGCFPLLQSVADPLLVLQALQQAMNLIEVCYPHQQWWNSHKIVSRLYPLMHGTLVVGQRNFSQLLLCF